ncbi:hypothetical protein A3D00_04570 [Candidatus Woesebacteria bacterium RIFCSPHIGHO2_02_FULL_38_9]|uniref:Glutaredoxin domain-containing protein n=1 Tax=Candidatus Woesebacteria bacterium RIFCSPHIGHO2_01_FULL_39_28 TaxID=1802496 RepID=A0A1F7YN05_9BACT|nr:MAG: hypothetical protein A2627_00390 [Candidatus Woesebacteria bacterium RIFCSPHIGHO2_01_FULL_39_28]OGM31901.1 MAG: hypothetical protein A3D00_04570 [Candidatus Woesebacteria bacterium RIFCSPHIGHO2_02_FULL_38_9]OGM56729.1 MAG: hypothetical protein A3A50_05230 [Candidatus Woesebacteria bacterium RIFCSPLOWO2_01_FULL_38_20]
MQIIVYSTTTCPYCRMLKDYLGANKISYIEKLVDQDEVAKNEMMKESSGFLGVPFTVIVKDDGIKETVLGFDKGKINQVLQISQ